MEEKDKKQRSKEEKLMFLRSAEEHGITEACQMFAIPRTTYYSWKRKLEQGGGRGPCQEDQNSNKELI